MQHLGRDCHEALTQRLQIDDIVTSLYLTRHAVIDHVKSGKHQPLQLLLDEARLSWADLHVVTLIDEQQVQCLVALPALDLCLDDHAEQPLLVIH